MKTSNPMFRDSVFENVSVLGTPMTVSGTINKLLLLTIVMLISAAAVFYQFSLQRMDLVQIFMTTGCIIGFILLKWLYALW